MRRGEGDGKRDTGRYDGERGEGGGKRRMGRGVGERESR